MLSGIGIIISGIKQFDNFAKNLLFVLGLVVLMWRRQSTETALKVFSEALSSTPSERKLRKALTLNCCSARKIYYDDIICLFSSDNFVFAVSKLRQSMAAQYVKS